MLASLAGCRTVPPVLNGAPTPSPPTSQIDESHDWHSLLVAPLGSALKDVPIPLHEVWLFRDEEHSGAEADDAECYGADAPPRFLGRTPDQFLLCFKQDRLFRIQASMRLTGAQASDVFAAACADWLKQAADDAAGQGGACEGHDGDVRFSGRLEEGTGEQGTPETELILSITLDGQARE
jgi:hypothetical protein